MFDGNYWMLDFTEAERLSISAILAKTTPLTQEETDLLNRWNAASAAHQAAQVAAIDAFRAAQQVQIANRAALASSSLADLEDLADYYTELYESTLGVENEQE